MPSTKQVKVFISYAHKDQELREELEKHLSSLKQSGKIAIWQDQEILPGDIWNDQIKTSLREADLVLLLVSASFLASDYIREEEMQETLERHKAGTVRVIPVILRPVDWQDTPLGQLQALPRGAKPVTRWDDRDDAFENVAQGIRSAVEKIIAVPPPPAPSPLQPAKVGPSKLPRRWIFLTAIVVALILVVTSGIFVALLTSHTPKTTLPSLINEPNNEQIGLSDGTHAFDTGANRADASLKTQAAVKFAQGDKSGATSLWRQAVRNDTSDAEALIYLEDQRVLDSGSRYITLVVGTMLTGDANTISSGHNALQGAYVAQKEYNDGVKLSDGTRIRLLVANAGSKSDYVTEVARQIVQAAQQDPTIIGVMGWPRSPYVQNVVPVLAHAGIPMVSSTASADTLSGISPYFFRVAPPNTSEAIAGAKYAEQQLHASRVVVFVDPNDSYSSSLADDFKQQFGHQIVDTQTYTVGDQASLHAPSQSLLTSNPDLLYFAGYAGDVGALLVDLPTSLPNLQVLGGDALYAPTSYPASAKPGFSRLHFTAFAYPDEWGILGMNEPLFFSEYPNDFNPAHADHAANPYGFTRANYGTILSYDATFALLQGCQNVLDAKSSLAPEALRDGLSKITGAKAIQGASGQISFGSNGDPINKAVVILYVDQDGHIQMFQPNGVLGCFVVGKCG